VTHNTNILARIDAIAIGCLFAIHKDRILTLMKSSWSLILFVSIIVMFVLNFYENNLPGQGIARKTLYVLGGLDGTISNFAIACIMFYSVFGPENWWHALLNTKVLNYIGILSYSLYLWQELFINRTDLLINIFPLNLVLIFAAGLFSYYVIEKPFLRLKSKY